MSIKTVERANCLGAVLDDERISQAAVLTIADRRGRAASDVVQLLPDYGSWTDRVDLRIAVEVETGVVALRFAEGWIPDVVETLTDRRFRYGVLERARQGAIRIIEIRETISVVVDAVVADFRVRRGSKGDGAGAGAGSARCSPLVEHSVEAAAVRERAGERTARCAEVTVGHRGLVNLEVDTK